MKNTFWVAAVAMGILFSTGSVQAFSEQRKYIGQEFDADTGLNYLNARYYNPAIGRFTAQDPLFWEIPAELLADPQQLNSYSYARNNPIVYSDPTGKYAEVVMKDLGLIPGAHGFINIVPEQGEDLSQYDFNGGDGSHYTIGGYASGRNPVTNKLKARINESGDYNLEASDRLATYPLEVPKGMTTAQYDRKLLESGHALTERDLGPYFGLGRPVSPHANSGNTWTQVVVNSGGEIPKINLVYGDVGKMPYFPYGSGHSVNTPWAAYSAIQAVSYTGKIISNTASGAAKATLNSISSKLSSISLFINSLKSQ